MDNPVKVDHMGISFILGTLYMNVQYQGGLGYAIHNWGEQGKLWQDYGYHHLLPTY